MREQKKEKKGTGITVAPALKRGKKNLGLEVVFIRGGRGEGEGEWFGCHREEADCRAIKENRDYPDGEGEKK